MSSPLRLVIPVLLLPALFLAGCFGGTAAVQRSEVQQRADTALVRALRAEQRGDRHESEQFLLQALELATSVEDDATRTTALINLARINRLRHELQKAGGYIEQALASTGSGPRLSSETAYEKALILLAVGRTDAALEWARTALAKADGNSLGSRLNLVGRIHLARGEWKEAGVLAGQALDENRSAGQPEEEANSLRIMGVVARYEKRFEQSELQLQEALRIDKRIGRSGKIASDLEELAELSRAAGRLQDAAGRLERAYEVHRAAGRPGAARADQKALETIYRSLGDTGRAERARALAAQGSQEPGSPSTTTSPSSRP